MTDSEKTVIAAGGSKHTLTRHGDNSLLSLLNTQKSKKKKKRKIQHDLIQEVDLTSTSSLLAPLVDEMANYSFLKLFRINERRGKQFDLQMLVITPFQSEHGTLKLVIFYRSSMSPSVAHMVKGFLFPLWRVFFFSSHFPPKCRHLCPNSQSPLLPFPLLPFPKQSSCSGGLQGWFDWVTATRAILLLFWTI